MSNARVYVACFAVYLQSVCVGVATGWTSPMLPRLTSGDASIRANLTQAGWLASLAKIAAACSALSAFVVADRLGRKVAILLALMPNALSWLLMIWATTIGELYACRVLIGISDGLLTVCGTIYATEIAPPRLRHALIVGSTLAQSLGTWLGYLIGDLATTRCYSYASLTLLGLHLVGFARCPETPYHLLRAKRYEECRRSLTFLRRASDVSEEMDSIMRSVEADRGRVQGRTGILRSIRDLLSRPGGGRIVAASLALSLMSTLSGTCALIGYAESILGEVDGIDPVDAPYFAALLGVVPLLGWASIRLGVNRVGHRAVLVVSSLGTSCASCLVGVYFRLQADESNRPIREDLAQQNLAQQNLAQLVQTRQFSSQLAWLPVIGLTSHVLMASCGVDLVAVRVVNEIVPIYARACCLSIGAFLACAASAILLKFWIVIVANCGLYAAFWILSAFGLVNFAIAIYCADDTSRRTMQEDQGPYYKEF